MIFSLWLCFFAVVAALQPSDVPVFDIDLDLPADQRYAAVWAHFGEELYEVEKMFVGELTQMDPKYLQFFEDNEAKFKEVQPDVWTFAKGIQDHVKAFQPDFSVAEALLVNAVVDFSSFCTSIVAMNETDVVHVRNLDFDLPSIMQKVVYIQRLVRKGEEIAFAPSIAGFYGVYTSLLPGKFSLSYNVRDTFRANSSEGVAAQAQLEKEGILGLTSLISARPDDIWKNLNLELDPSYTPTQNLMIEVVTTAASFDEAASELLSRKVNAPAYVILASANVSSLQESKFGSGVIITRSREGVDHLEVLSLDRLAAKGNESWFIAQTNSDVWHPEVKDPRYEKTVDLMISTKSQKEAKELPYVETGVLVEDVLRVTGVTTFITIFQAGMKPQEKGARGSYVDVYYSDLQETSTQLFLG